MCDQWLQNMDDGKLNGVVVLDIWKPFDSISHDILLQEKVENISNVQLNSFESFLINIESRHVKCGVKQGLIFVDYCCYCISMIYSIVLKRQLLAYMQAILKSS